MGKKGGKKGKDSHTGEASMASVEPAGNTDAKLLTVYTEHLVARIFSCAQSVRCCCQVVIHHSFPCTRMAQDEAVSIFQHSSYFAQHVVHCT